MTKITFFFLDFSWIIYEKWRQNFLRCATILLYFPSMSSINKIEPLILLLGDLILFYAALWSALFLRHFEVPDSDLLVRHAIPFSYLFGAWVVVFFIAGLYEKHTTLFKSRLPSILSNAQLANSVIAVIFFYFLPYFGINPKTNLFIYLVLSFI